MEIRSKIKKALTVLELKRLFIEIQEQRPDICVRYRLMGEMWKSHFFTIVLITETGGFFRDESNDRLMHISTLDKIIQFEIDHGFQHYQPHFHYDIVMDPLK